jgi:hypothetical protein
MIRNVNLSVPLTLSFDLVDHDTPIEKRLTDRGGALSIDNAGRSSSTGVFQREVNPVSHPTRDWPTILDAGLELVFVSCLHSGLVQ